MKLSALFIILLLSTMLFAQTRWDEDCQLLESDYQYWRDSFSGEDVSYYCWVEESETGYQIKVQGVSTDQEFIWAEPVIQATGTEYPDEAEITLDNADNIYLYWHDNSYPDSLVNKYVQKISVSGDLIWGNAGQQIDLESINNVEILSDNAGGLYIQRYTEFWHLDENGSIIDGWEDGIDTGSSTGLRRVVTENGDLAIFKKVVDDEQSLRYFQIISGDGIEQYPGEGLYCGAGSSYQADLLRIDDEYMIAWVNSDTILSNKILSEGEFLYPEPQILGEAGNGNQYYGILNQGENYYLCLNNNDQNTLRLDKYDDAWQFIATGSELSYYDPLRYMQVKPDGNILILASDMYNLILVEYNESGELISPETGWMEFIGNYNSYDVKGDQAGNCYVTSEVLDANDQVGFCVQILNNESELIFDNNGLLFCQQKKIVPKDSRIIALEDKTAIFWTETTDTSSRVMIQYLDEDGNALLPEGGLQLLYNNDYQHYFQYIYGDKTSILVKETGSIDWFEDDYTNFHNIILDEEPWLAWGENGLNWEGAEIERELHALRNDEGNIFFYWQNYEEETRAQLIEDCEFVLPDDHSAGIGYGTILTIKDNYVTYESGDNILLTLWDENYEPLWEESVWLTGVGYYDAATFEYVEDGNLVKYWVSHECDIMHEYSWKIKKQIISASGEKLLGPFALEIYDNGDVKIKDFFYIEEPEQIGVVCGEENEFLLKYMTMSGELISDEFITFEELDGRSFDEISSQNSMLMVQTSFWTDSGVQSGICIYDLLGNSIAGLPGADFSVPSESFYDLCFDEEYIYYCWRTIHLPDYIYSGGFDAYAQQISLPVNGIGSEQLPAINMELKTYPNPFNPEVKISWQLAELCEDSRLAVFNIKGQKVREYSVNVKAGQVVWNGRNAYNEQCASGIYLLMLQSGDIKQSAKVLMLK
ncbi:MAG: T9SS type A sorting domain-containing protein [Candidatus Cloacimonetes bacterium]|nr:T9SS type A sorting domain-containing protein [Candidatus Cloacimonadota bacterium]